MNRIVALAFLLALSGCGGAMLPAIGGAAGAGLLASTASYGGAAVTILSDVAKIACAGQAAANAAGDAAASLGKPAAAASAGTVSRALGIACSW